MANEVLDQLYSATFRGVPFLFTETQRKGGRKNTQHEYPNTDRRFVEDLGKMVPTFTIGITINGKEDYRAKRDKFIEALEKPGSGQLSHPFYGMQTVSVLSYTLDESIKAIGVASFSVEFAVTGDNIYPKAENAGSGVVRAKVANLAEKTQTYVTNNFTPASMSKAQQAFNVTMLTDMVSQSNTAISKVLQQVQAVGTSISQVQGVIRYITGYPNTIVSRASSLASNMFSIFDSFDSIDVDANTIYPANKALFNYRSTTTLPRATTIRKVKNEKNHNIVTGTFNILALIYAYQAASEMEYETTDDIASVKTDLEDQYQYLLTIADADYDLMNDVKDIRGDMRQFFTDLSKTVYKATNINTSQMPLTVLVHQYYGDVDIEDDILALNQLTETPFVQGSVRILVQ